MTLLFADIETIPVQDQELKDFVLSTAKAPGNYKKQETIDKWLLDNESVALDKTSFDGTFGQICTISWALDDGEIQSIQRRGDSEKSLIEYFFDKISTDLRVRTDALIKPIWIAHNKEFDLRFLFLRSIILKCDNQSIIIPVNDRYKSFCTMQAWRGIYKKDGGSLKAICKVLGIKCKEGMTGADVWPAYQNKEYDKIEDYCRDDVKALREVYKRLTPYIEA